MALTDIGERLALDATLTGTLTVALYTAAPGEAGGGTEVSGGSYARQSITFNAAATVSGTTTADNAAEVLFPVATANWGTVVAAGVFNGSDLVWYGNLTISRTVNSGDQFRFAAGSIAVGIE
jgi:hypothetical protein